MAEVGAFESYLESLTDEQFEVITAIAMDMHQAYIQASLATVPDAERKTVFDLYHIMQHTSGAVDEVRRKEHKALAEEGDTRLAKSKRMWLYGQERGPRKYCASFYVLRKSDLKTLKAWALKENLRRLWRHKRLSVAASHWKSWYFWATHCGLNR